MKITVFAKKRTTHEGKKFMTYISRLTKKDGTEVTSAVKFREGCGTPTDFPCIINVNKNDCNMSTKEVVDKDTGVIYVNNTLWIKAWTPSNEKYEDTSMDDFV